MALLHDVPGEDDYTRGGYPIPRSARSVWVDLDIALPRCPGHQRRVIVDGIVVTGRVPGALQRWVRGAEGEWLGVVNIEFRDGAGDVRLRLQQLVPVTALEPSSEASNLPLWPQIGGEVIGDSMALRTSIERRQ